MSFSKNMDIRETVSLCSFYLGSGNEIKKVLSQLAILEVPLDLLNQFSIKEKVAKYLKYPFSGVPQLAATVIQKIEKLEEEEKERCPEPVYAFCFLQKRSRGFERVGDAGVQQPSAKRIMSFSKNMDIRETVSLCSFYLGCGNEIKKVLSQLAALEIPLDILNNFGIKEKVAKYLKYPFSGVPQMAATVIQKIEKLEEEEKKKRCSEPVYTFCFLQKRSRGFERFGDAGVQQPSAKRVRFE